MTPELRSFASRYSQRVNQLLTARLPKPSEGSERLLDAMRYSLLLGGKRIRPILAYASANAVGQINNLTDAAACSLECMHAYSLIHDDLPSMDDDDLRRGEPTCHLAFDEATAILAGDALQSLAFEILTEDTRGSETTVVALVRELGRGVGARGMVAGQAMDLAAVSQKLSLEQLERMHRHKTGALIEAGVVMGAVSTGSATRAQLDALRRYAQAIGLAFQVQDDILDVTAPTQALGKRAGADQERDKPTYVALLGLEPARAKARELHEQALQALQDFDTRADHLRDLASFVVERAT